MIIEHVLLHIRPGEEAAFEAAMLAAQPLITVSPGFMGCEVRPAAEKTGTYLLLVRWKNIADHRGDSVQEGFRQSERYQLWRTALHGFYDPMPEVIYFKDSFV